MSEDVSEIKKQKTQQYNPEIIFRKTRKEEDEAVSMLSKEKGLVSLSSYNYIDVIAGAGTFALEVLQELPHIKHFISPLGGGGLMGGTSFTLKKMNSDVETIAIEPEGAGDYYLSVKRKKKSDIGAASYYCGWFKSAHSRGVELAAFTKVCGSGGNRTGCFYQKSNAVFI